MKRTKVPYDVSFGGLLLTRCKLTGVLIGSEFCMRCRAYESKNRADRYVVCRRDYHPLSKPDRRCKQTQS